MADHTPVTRIAQTLLAEGDHLVHEAVGPSLTGLQAAATIGVGINSLLFAGVLPILLGALADEHRLSASGIGLTAMTEALAMGVATAAMGLIRRPERLRLVGVLASLAVAGLNLAAMEADGVMLIALRGATGASEGVLLWITVSMIARTVTPERWAGAFFTAQTLAQLLLAMALAAVFVPLYGANGVFGALAVLAVVGVVPALLSPTRFAPLPVRPDASEAPTPRGWMALAATLVFVSAGAAVGVYVQPLAHEAGLGAGVARTAVWVALAGQVAGGALATSLAGRLGYFTVFIITSVVDLAVWAAFSQPLSAWMFIVANALGGLVGLFLGPFLVPMIIDADPSRRAAMQSGAAQLLGGALGPMLASQVVGDRDVHGVLWLAAALLAVGFSGVAWLRFTARPWPVVQES
ncbi:MAG: transporter [Caulobacteraceae bacterium]|nr:transporter [Caulobacteraceae bacterium]